jgi:hypothetical protein
MKTAERASMPDGEGDIAALSPSGAGGRETIVFP